MTKKNKEITPVPKPKKNKVKATDKQRKTFQHMKKATSLRDAMLKGGYSKTSAIDPSKNFLEREGVKPLIEEYREHLINAGISSELLAEIQAEGLFDQNASTRLSYVKETKKDFGLQQTPDVAVQTNIQFKLTRGEDE